MEEAVIGKSFSTSKNAEIGVYGIKCACMQQITLEHIRKGYHPPCMRNIKIVLEETL